MPWQPQPTLTINGVDLTAAALETVRITRGRTEVYAEPRAGYLLAELIDLNGDGLPIQPFDQVTFTLNDTAGIPRTVFRGRVSDTASRLWDNGVESGTAGSVMTIIAVGALARMARRRVLPDGLPAQQDGDRIADLVSAATARTWEETSGTWQQQGTVAWEDFDPDFDLDRIDQPGVFDLAARPPTPEGFDPLNEGNITGLSALGILWDDREGFIAYADADRRVATDQADDYLDLPPAAITSQLAVQSQAGDIATRVAVAYEGGVRIVQDAGAVLKYGRVERGFETVLANESNADLWAEQYLRGHSGPIIKLQEVGVRLDLLDDDTLIDQLLTVDVNDGIRLLGLPATLGVTFPRTFVEGISWRVDRERVGIDLSLSNAALSIGFQRWSSVDPSLAWQDVDATLTWQDATTVTA